MTLVGLDTFVGIDSGKLTGGLLQRLISPNAQRPAFPPDVGHQKAPEPQPHQQREYAPPHRLRHDHQLTRIDHSTFTRAVSTPSSRRPTTSSTRLMRSPVCIASSNIAATSSPCTHSKLTRLLAGLAKSALTDRTM